MRLIIIQGGEDDSAGAPLRCIFRFPVPADFQARFATKFPISQDPDATQEELDALAAGQFFEIAETNSFPDGTTQNKLDKALEDIYQARATEFIRREKKRRTYAGRSWDGTVWSNK